MSNEDSFIQEVSDEVRRDRLYGLLRRYGWIAATLVVLLVGGAAFFEWQKAQRQAKAQALGDQILAGLQSDDVTAAVAGIQPADATPEAQAILGLLSAIATEEPEDRAASRAALDELALSPNLPPAFRDLAILKSAMLGSGEVPPEDRIAALEPISLPGAPYALLAQELIAMAEIERGDNGRARELLAQIAADVQASEGLRRRATELIVALGGEQDAG